MKFSCSQQSLSKAINTVLKAISVRTTIPILRGILMVVEDGKLTMTTSNLDMSIETSIDVQSSENGACVCDAKMISEIVRRLPNAMISFSSDDRDNLDILCLGSEFKVVTMPADEYPAIGKVEEGKECSIDKRVLIDLIKKTSFAASIDEKKGILVGILIDLDPYRLELAALDGFRMAVARAEIHTGADIRVVIPSSLMNDVAKLLIESENTDEVKIVIDSKKAEFSYEDTRIVARQLEGEFIKYNDILPKEYKTRFIINRSELQGSIERASLFANEGKNNLIKLTVSDSDLTINSRSEKGNVNERINIEKSGEDQVIGFNSKYVTDVLRAVDDEDLAFEMTSSVSSCLIKPVDGDGYVYLVLPVRISV